MSQGPDPTLAVSGRRGRRPTLTLDAIIRAAGDVAEFGVDQMTMAGVAERLGVSAMALYQYVEGKNHLLALLLDSLLATIEVPPSDFGSWEDRLRTLHMDVTDAMTRYPGLVPQIETVGEAPRLLEGYLEVLADSGLDDHGVAVAYTGLYYLAMGAQYHHRDSPIASPAARPPDDPSHVATARAAESLRSTTSRDLQLATLDIFIDGIRTQLRRAKRANSRRTST